MSRRGENIHKRKDGRWEARYMRGRKADGSILYGYVYSQTYADVKRKQQEALQNLKTDFPAKRCDPYISFASFYVEWKYDTYHLLKESSRSFYDTLTKKHLLPAFGPQNIFQIDGAAIQDFINSKIQSEYSPAYIRSMLTLLLHIIQAARKKYNRETAPTYFCPPKNPLPRQAKFPNQDWHRLDSYLRGCSDDFTFGILLCMHTGIRIGELSGLKWDDFDLEQSQLMIRRTVYRVQNPAYDGTLNVPKTILSVTPPKTTASNRVIPLTNFLLKEVQNRKRDDGIYVVSGARTCMEPRTIQKKYRKLLKDCRIPYLNFHALKHSFASMGIQKGFDYKSLSEILGHASVATTLNVYVHSDMEQKRQCMERLLL